MSAKWKRHVAMHTERKKKRNMKFEQLLDIFSECFHHMAV